MNGMDVESTAPGKTLEYTNTSIKCVAPNAYKGVDYTRSINLTDNGFNDVYEVNSKTEATFDFVFHLEADINYVPNLLLEEADLGFKSNGYEHIVSVKRVKTDGKSVQFNFFKNLKLISYDVDCTNKEVFLLQTMDNPVNKTRTTILVREIGKKITFKSTMLITEKTDETIQNYFFNKDIEGKVVGDGVFRIIVAYNDNLMTCEVSFKKGAIGAMHQHPHEQCTYIVSGKFEFTVGDVTKIVSAGDCLYKQPNIVHGAVCLEEGMLIDIFTPCRKDFL